MRSVLVMLAVVLFLFAGSNLAIAQNGPAFIDVSGNGHHGDPHDDAASALDAARPGSPGKNVLVLDGTNDHADDDGAGPDQDVGAGGGTPDWVSVRDEPAFDVTGQYTMVAWVQNDGFSREWEAVLSKGDSTYRMGRFGGSQKFGTVLNNDGCPGGGGCDQVQSDADNDGAWHHMAVTYNIDPQGVGDLTEGTVSLYIDGVLQTLTNPGNNPFTTFGGGGDDGVNNVRTNDSPLSIGLNYDSGPANFGGGYRGWGGKLDDVGLYSAQLSEQQIGVIMAEGLLGDSSAAGSLLVGHDFESRVPEPTTAVMMLLGLTGLLSRRRGR